MGIKTHPNLITSFAVCQQNIHIFYLFFPLFIREDVKKTGLENVSCDVFGEFVGVWLIKSFIFLKKRLQLRISYGILK